MNINIPAAIMPDTLIINRYRIVDALEQGDAYLSYLAYDTRSDIQVLLQEFFVRDYCTRKVESTVLLKSLLHKEQFECERNRFKNKAYHLARFRHPNIPRIQDYFESNNTVYIVTEYEGGDRFAALLLRDTAISTETLLAIFTPLLRGLARFHCAGFVHCAIKPSNICFREDGSPILTDFGAVWQEVGVQHVPSTTWPELMPYQPLGQFYGSNYRLGPWTDIYAMGTVLYQAVTLCQHVWSS